jgi:hypothetical protein
MFSCLSRSAGEEYAFFGHGYFRENGFDIAGWANSD